MKRLFFTFITFIFTVMLFAQNDVAIYWDAYYSMKNRDLNKELKFLDNYFNKFTDSDVKLVVFSNEILSSSNYKITNGDWSGLKEELMSVVYDGATNFDGVFTIKASSNLLFTDGVEISGKLPYVYNSPIHIVSTNNETNSTRLKLLSEATGGRFYYLNAKATSLETDQQLVEEGYSDGSGSDISGVVTGVEGALANVSIVNQSTGEGIASEADGSYHISANENDVLVFSYLGKKTVSVRTTKANVINITMSDISQSLDEVVLTNEKEVEAEFVNTGNGKVDTRRLGYDVEEIDNSAISDQDIDLIGAAKGQFTNFEIQNDIYNKADISQFLGRGKNMTILLNQFGLIVVDGVPLGQSESNFGGLTYPQDNIINPDMIASITYLKGLAATNKFGTLGRNGVLLVTTKNAVLGEDPQRGKNVPLGTTDTYKGNAVSLNKLADIDYINALKKATNVNEAFKTYLGLRSKHESDYAFFVNVADYFTGWNNPLITKRILSNVNEFAKSIEALKAVAYKQEEYGFIGDALTTYKQIEKLFPEKSQSKRDLALAYVYNNKIDEALDVYDDMLSLNTNNNGLKKTLTNEFKNLVNNKAKTKNLARVDDKYKRPISYKSRIVFEWNNFDAEFDLNIINPQNRFVTISHTQDENAEKISREKQQGYALEEFYLTDADVGKWNFNMTYYGNNSMTPTFVKITTYKNYGTARESKQIKVVRLDKLNLEQVVNQVAIN